MHLHNHIAPYSLQILSYKYVYIKKVLTVCGPIVSFNNLITYESSMAWSQASQIAASFWVQLYPLITLIVLFILGIFSLQIMKRFFGLLEQFQCLTFCTCLIFLSVSVSSNDTFHISVYHVGISWFIGNVRLLISSLLYNFQYLNVL